MGLWSFYFLLKLGLHLQGQIHMDWRLNLAFAVAVSFPMSRWIARFRQVLTVPLGIILLYLESNLPPLTRLATEFSLITSFEGRYLLELAGRLISLDLIIGLVLAAFFYWMLSCKFRMGSFAILGILLLPAHAAWQTLLHPQAKDPTLQQAAARGPKTPGELLASFYQDESLRLTRFEKPLRPEADFDIVILHVCSLAWDDLDLLDQSQPTLFQRAAIQFTAFNSAATYSGPAAIRLLRASCGQPSHDSLYSPPSSSCLLLSQLTRMGYRTRLALNHSGDFGGFLTDIENNSGGASWIKPPTGLLKTMRQFDGDPIYSDLAMLQQWATSTREQPEALYYNTTSLHDGNRLLERPRLSSIESYPLRLQGLFSDITQFLDDLESRKRPAVVMLVPEHGAALRGDAEHIAGLRELPTPAITHTPALVFLTGLDSTSDALTIDAPTSYLAIAELLARFVKESPFATDAPPLTAFLQGLPTTRLVAENDGLIVMHDRSRFLKRDPVGNWETLHSGLGRYNTVNTAR